MLRVKSFLLEFSDFSNEGGAISKLILLILLTKIILQTRSKHLQFLINRTAVLYGPYIKLVENKVKWNVA
jgi:hypothetical protein